MISAYSSSYKQVKSVYMAREYPLFVCFLWVENTVKMTKLSIKKNRVLKWLVYNINIVFIMIWLHFLFYLNLYYVCIL